MFLSFHVQMPLHTSAWVFTTICVSRLARRSFLLWSYYWNALVLAAIVLLVIIQFWVGTLTHFTMFVLNMRWAASLSWISTHTLEAVMSLINEWGILSILLRSSSCSCLVSNLMCSTCWITGRAYTLKQDVLIEHLGLGSFILWDHVTVSNWIMMAIYYHISYAWHFGFL